MMAREQINENIVAEVTGGSIVFNADHTTCGHNCNDQYRVVNDDDVQAYIRDNCTKMSERTMIKNMLAAGLLEEL